MILRHSFVPNTKRENALVGEILNYDWAMSDCRNDITPGLPIFVATKLPLQHEFTQISFLSLRESKNNLSSRKLQSVSAHRQEPHAI